MFLRGYPDFAQAEIQDEEIDELPSVQDEPPVISPEMDEDIDARKTYFVKKGSMIADVEVKDILKDKVILTDGREEIEIR